MNGIQGFHHIALRVKDFDLAVRFYTKTLGLRKSREWGSAGSRGSS